MGKASAGRLMSVGGILRCTKLLAPQLTNSLTIMVGRFPQKLKQNVGNDKRPSAHRPPLPLKFAALTPVSSGAGRLSTT